MYLYQKLDEIYLQAFNQLKSKENEEDTSTNLSKEKEYKHSLRELFQIELSIRDAIPKGYLVGLESPHNLIQLLEVLYDDFELLPQLLLAFFVKIFKLDSGSSRESTHAKVLNFMVPFMEALCENEWDAMNLTKNFNALQTQFSQLEEFLRKNSSLAEEEILSFLTELKQKGNNSFEFKRSIRRFCEEKMKNREENLYYEFLGRVSLILQLGNIEKNKDNLPPAWLKLTLISYFCAGMFCLIFNLNFIS